MQRRDDGAVGGLQRSRERPRERETAAEMKNPRNTIDRGSIPYERKEPVNDMGSFFASCKKRKEVSRWNRSRRKIFESLTTA